MLKIALIEGPYLRPSGIKTWEYLNNTSEDIEIVCFESDPPNYDTSNLDMEVRQLPWVDGKVDLFGYEQFFSKSLRHIRFPSNFLYGVGKIIDEFDIVHAAENYHLFTLQAALATRGTSTKFVFSVGQNIPYPTTQRNPLLWQIKKFVNKSADAINTTTPLAKRALIHEGTNHDKIEVIPNSTSTDIFSPTNESDPKDVGLGDNEEVFRILFVHKLCEQKGTKYLIDAFIALQKETDTKLELVLVGDNQLNDNYSSLITEVDTIRWLEYVPYEKMSTLYNVSDVLVLPSVTMEHNEEQFGMAVLEAMACGVPTITTRVGGLPYLTSGNETTLHIDERSSEELLEALKKLINNEELLERLSKNSRERAVNMFDTKVVAGQLETYYFETA